MNVAKVKAVIEAAEDVFEGAYMAPTGGCYCTIGLLYKAAGASDELLAWRMKYERESRFFAPAPESPEFASYVEWERLTDEIDEQFGVDSYHRNDLVEANDAQSGAWYDAKPTPRERVLALLNLYTIAPSAEGPL